MTPAENESSRAISTTVVGIADTAPVGTDLLALHDWLHALAKRVECGELEAWAALLAAAFAVERREQVRADERLNRLIANIVAPPPAPAPAECPSSHRTAAAFDENTGLCCQCGQPVDAHPTLYVCDEGEAFVRPKLSLVPPTSTPPATAEQVAAATPRLLDEIDRLGLPR